MSVSVGKNVFDADIINKVLTSNFKTMDKLGNGVRMCVCMFVCVCAFVHGCLHVCARWISSTRSSYTAAKLWTNSTTVCARVCVYQTLEQTRQCCVSVCVCQYLCVCVCVCTCVCVYVYVCVHVCMCLCVCASVYAHVCVFMCICVCEQRHINFSDVSSVVNLYSKYNRKPTFQNFRLLLGVQDKLYRAILVKILKSQLGSRLI